MKKFFTFLLAALTAFSVFAAALCADAADGQGASYYIDSIDGSDETGDGLTPETAWKSVPVTECTLGTGDSVLFRRGGVYECTLTVRNSRGTEDAPILIGAYGEGQKPVLTTNARTETLRLFDCSFVTVEGLEITAPNGGGIWIDALNAPSEGIALRDLTIHDIQNYKVTSRDNLSAGAAEARACVPVCSLK